MGQLVKLAAAFAAGAAAMYLLDPVGGRRRRTMARDKVLASGRDIQDFAQDTGRHAADRLCGAVHLRAHAPSEDRRLQDHIRARLGHLVAQPGKVGVDVTNGLVTLSGSAGLGEVGQLVAAVSDMPGVTRVDNRLEALQLPPASQSRH